MFMCTCVCECVCACVCVFECMTECLCPFHNPSSLQHHYLISFGGGVVPVDLDQAFVAVCARRCMCDYFCVFDKHYVCECVSVCMFMGACVWQVWLV